VQRLLPIQLISSPRPSAQAPCSAQELQLLDQLVAAGRAASLQQLLLLLVANELLAALAGGLLQRHSGRASSADACRAQLQELRSVTRAAAEALAQLPAAGAGEARGDVEAPPAVVEAACLRRPGGRLSALLGLVAELSGEELWEERVRVAVGGCGGFFQMGWLDREPGDGAS
jgi:hypothetical protein